MNMETVRKTFVLSTLVFLGGGVVGAFLVSPKTCLSPAAESKPYKGDKALGAEDNDRNTWVKGIEATTINAPRDDSYMGLTVGFRDPNSRTAEWKNSEPVGGESDDKIQLKIGEGDVQFRIQILAKAGSALCRDIKMNTPSTTFSDPKPLDELQGTKPVW